MEETNRYPLSDDDRPAPRKQGRLSFVIGLIIIAFAVVGIVFTASKAVSLYREKAAEKEKALLASYSDFVIPVLAVDPSVFDDTASASMAELIEISIWSIISGDMNANNYSYTSDSLAIPQADVEAAFIKYFGNAVTIEHMSVEGYGYEFAYDSASSSYKLPLTGLTPIYTPSVTDIETKTDSIVLTVGCINSSFWMQDDNGGLSSPSPDKYLKITLRGTQDNYRITSIRATGTPETALVEQEVITVASTTAAIQTETTQEESTTD